MFSLFADLLLQGRWGLFIQILAVWGPLPRGSFWHCKSRHHSCPFCEAQKSDQQLTATYFPVACYDRYISTLGKSLFVIYFNIRKLHDLFSRMIHVWSIILPPFQNECTLAKKKNLFQNERHSHFSMWY